MNGIYARGALLGAVLFTLAACGGGGGSSNNNAGDGTNPPAPPASPSTELTSTENAFTEAFCPSAVTGQVEGRISATDCQAEATAGIPGLNGNVLARFCPEAAEDFAVITYDGDSLSVLPMDFGPACLQELAGMLGNLDDLLGDDGGNPLLTTLCPNASLSNEFNPADCLTEALSLGNGDLPGIAELTELVGQIPVLGDIVGALLGGDGLPGEFPGLDGLCDPTDPLGCLGALAELLNPLTEPLAQIPVLGDILNGLLSGELPGGGGGLPDLGGLCDPADPASCLTALTGLLAPLTEPLAQIPMLGDIINGLLGGELPGGELPDLGGLCDPSDPMSCLSALTGLLAPLAEPLAQIPVLGDIINGLLGGELPGGGLPDFGGLCDPADPMSCLGALTGLLAPLTEPLAQIPVLGDIINGLLGGELPGGGLPDFGGLCDPSDPMSCLGALTGLLAPLTDLLGGIPVLGDIVNGLLGGELPDGGLPDLGGLCDPSDPMSCLSALTSQLAPLTDAIGQVPVLGDVVSGLLEALLSGGTPTLPGVPDLEGLCGDAADPLQCLLSVEQLQPITDLLTQVPIVGDILGGLLGGVLGGGNGGGDNPLADIPVLGPILGPILGGLFG